MSSRGVRGRISALQRGVTPLIRGNKKNFSGSGGGALPQGKPLRQKLRLEIAVGERGKHNRLFSWEKTPGGEVSRRGSRKVEEAKILERKVAKKERATESQDEKR